MKKATVILRFLTAVVCMAVLLLSVGCSAEPEAMQPGSCYITAYYAVTTHPMSTAPLPYGYIITLGKE